MKKVKIFLLLFIFTIISLGCIEPKNFPAPNETKINITFETWSRGYWSNSSYDKPYFKVITNYSRWHEFLDEQGYFYYINGTGPMRL